MITAITNIRSWPASLAKPTPSPFPDAAFYFDNNKAYKHYRWTVLAPRPEHMLHADCEVNSGRHTGATAIKSVRPPTGRRPVLPVAKATS